jgi:hypothetical protein
MHRQQTHPSRARRLHAHPQRPPQGPVRTNYPMIFHEPALADLDALALDDEAPISPPTPCGSSNEGRGACFASASGSEPDGGSGARDGRHAVVGEVVGGRQPLRPGEATAAIEGATSIEDRLHAYARSFRACSRSTVGQNIEPLLQSPTRNSTVACLLVAQSSSYVLSAASGVKQQRAHGRRSPGPPGPNHARRGCLRKRVFLHTAGRALVSAMSR